jgi:hypothetical protein
VHFIGLEFIFQLLKYLFIYDICGHVGGAFPTYIARFQTIFHKGTVFIALKEHPLLKSIFQNGEELVQTFHISPFEFTLVEDAVDMDVCLYHVKQGQFQVHMTFIGLDSRVPCGKYSNVDFVHFVWQFNDMLGFRRQAMKILPDPSTGHMRLLYLRHYSVASIGWTFTS